MPSYELFHESRVVQLLVSLLHPLFVLASLLAIATARWLPRRIVHVSPSVYYDDVLFMIEGWIVLEHKDFYFGLMSTGCSVMLTTSFSKR